MTQQPVLPSSEVPKREYAVFISYRHADNKEPGRQWASWLHHALETYEIPSDLAGSRNDRNEIIPHGLYPVFRDEEELPAHSDLTTNIQTALENSRLLVILCSPRAVQSKFVADEIRIFKELGRAGRILAVIIDGEPNASEENSGLDPALECLPHPLRFGNPDATGAIDWQARTEPIAADTRPEGRTVQGFTNPEAYRKSLEAEGNLTKQEISQRTKEYEQRLQLTVLKVVAGAIGVPVGVLTKRDKVRQLEAARIRARRLRVLTSLFGVIALLAVAAGIVAWIQKGQADQQRQFANEQRQRAEEKELEVRKGSSRSHFLTGMASLRRGENNVALASLAKAVRVDADNDAAATRLMTLLGQRHWVLPVRRFQTDQAVSELIIHPDRMRFVIGSALDAYEADGVSTVQIRDIATSRLLAPAHRVGRTAINQILTNATVDTIVPVLSHKGFSGSWMIPMPYFGTAPWLLDGTTNGPPTYNQINARAISPDGRTMIGELDGGLGVYRIGSDGKTDIRLLILLGEDAEINLDDALPEDLAEITLDKWTDSNVLAVGCSNNSVSVIGNDGGFWTIDLVARSAKFAGYARDAEGNPPLLSAFSKSGTSAAYLFPSGKLTIASAERGLSHSSIDCTLIQEEDFSGNLEFIGEGNDVSLIEYYRPNDQPTRAGWWQFPADKSKPLEWKKLPERTHSISPDGVVIVLEDKSAFFIDPITGEALSASMQHESFVTAATASKDDWFATGTMQGVVKVWKRLPRWIIPNTPPSSSYEAPEDGRVVAESNSGDLRILASGSPSRLDFTIQRGRLNSELPYPEPWDGFRSARFSPDATQLLVTGAQGLDGSTRGAADEGAALLSTKTGEISGSIMKHENCWWADFSPDSKTIATTGNDYVLLWDISGNTPPRRFMHEAVAQVIWHPSDPTLLISIGTETLRLWNLKTGGLIRETAHPKLREREYRYSIDASAFDDTGKRFFTLSSSWLTLWDTETLEPICDPIAVTDTPIHATFAQVAPSFTWSELKFHSNAEFLNALAATAELIAGLRISEDGSLESIPDQLAELDSLLNLLKPLAGNPEIRPLLSMVEDSFLDALRTVKPETIASQNAIATLSLLLQDSAYDHASPAYSGNEAWILNRNRIRQLEKNFATARALNPTEAERLIKGLLDSWQQRTDATAILTYWHFGDKSAAERTVARQTLETIRNELDLESDERYKIWYEEWQASMR